MVVMGPRPRLLPGTNAPGGLRALARGVALLVPLAADPELFRQTAAATCGLFLHGAPDLGWLEASPTRATALAMALGLGSRILPWRSRARTRWLNLMEGVCLLGFFGALPALASVGFFFAF